MMKRVLVILGWTVALLAGLAKILTYCNIPSETLFGKIATVGRTSVSLPVAMILSLAAVALAYLVGRGRFKGHKKLTVHSAVYGAGQSVIDVTAKLTALVKDNSLTVVAGNHLAGDPIYGTRKHLEVWFSYGTSQRKAVVREGGTLEIP
jgi:hypothetical protein